MTKKEQDNGVAVPLLRTRYYPIEITRRVVVVDVYGRRALRLYDYVKQWCGRNDMAWTTRRGRDVAACWQPVSLRELLCEDTACELCSVKQAETLVQGATCFLAVCTDCAREWPSGEISFPIIL